MLVVWLSLEDLICLIILGAPFFALVTIVAFIVRLVLIYRQRHKDKLLSILLLPFLAAPLENMLNSPISENRVETMITIEAPPHWVWEKIIRVDEISPDEYKSGLFNQLGIPRPISATLNEEKRGGVRTGHFWGGLKFTEVITVWQPHREVAFTIAVDNATIGKQIFQRHVLGGNYFKFLNARYRLKENQDGSTSLVLTSGYRLTSKVNFYGKFWGDWMLKDFQKRLLAVIKARCERFSNIDSK